MLSNKNNVQVQLSDGRFFQLELAHPDIPQINIQQAVFKILEKTKELDELIDIKEILGYNFRVFVDYHAITIDVWITPRPVAKYIKIDYIQKDDRFEEDIARWETQEDTGPKRKRRKGSRPRKSVQLDLFDQHVEGKSNGGRRGRKKV